MEFTYLEKTNYTVHCWRYVLLAIVCSCWKCGQLSLSGFCCVHCVIVDCMSTCAPLNATCRQTVLQWALEWRVVGWEKFPMYFLWSIILCSTCAGRLWVAAVLHFLWQKILYKFVARKDFPAQITMECEYAIRDYT